MLWSAISKCWEFWYHLRPMECPLSVRAHLYKRFECDAYECGGEQIRVRIRISSDNTFRTLQRPLTKVPNGQNAHSKWWVDELVTLFHVLSALWGALLFPSIPAIDRWMTDTKLTSSYKMSRNMTSVHLVTQIPHREVIICLLTR